MKKIKALREAGLRAEHVAFSFMKRRVQPLMATRTCQGCPMKKSMMKILSRGWEKYSRICHLIRRAQSLSSPRLVRQTKYMYETSALEYFLERE
jgi:uncharacterized membrane-anchored protein